MCVWIYCCGMAAHIWWITRVSSLRFLCSGCARILRCNRPSKWSIRLKYRRFAAILVFARCLLQAFLSVFCLMKFALATWHDVYSRAKIIPRLIGTDMKKKNRPNDVISISHRSYVFLNGYTWNFRVRENAWVRCAMFIFATFNVFHNRQSTRNTFLLNTLAVHEEPGT